jgi:hypothetical protein
VALGAPLTEAFPGLHKGTLYLWSHCSPSVSHLAPVGTTGALGCLWHILLPHSYATFLAVLGFELKTLCLLGRCSSTLSTFPALICHLLTGSALPVTAYDKNGFRILFHFAKECPPGRPDVLVVVVSMLNTAPLPVKSIVLQAAVPKVLQAPLGLQRPILPLP